VAEDVRNQINEAVGKLRETARGEDAEAIRRETEELGQLIQKIGASMYGGPEAAGGAAPGPEDAGPSDGTSGSGSGGSGGEDIVDGEFKSE
jgi:molecular chaperone DnaK